VVLGAPVTAIADDGRRVHVTAGERTYGAQRCIVAAPLPALRAVRFSPEPPRAVAEAIASLAYGTGGKVALRCARRVWRTQGFNGEIFTDRSLNTAWDAADPLPGEAGILQSYTVGAPGRAWTALDPAARIARAIADADAVYPGTRGAVTATHQAWWSGERYTGGTYSAYGVGQVAAFWRALRRPFGRVVLAGEHTDTYWGYMEGAVRSGVRAAALTQR
jgi:monoamine oxidase